MRSQQENKPMCSVVHNKTQPKFSFCLTEKVEIICNFQIPQLDSFVKHFPFSLSVNKGCDDFISSRNKCWSHSTDSETAAMVITQQHRIIFLYIDTSLDVMFRNVQRKSQHPLLYNIYYTQGKRFKSEKKNRSSAIT